MQSLDHTQPLTPVIIGRLALVGFSATCAVLGLVLFRGQMASGGVDAIEAAAALCVAFGLGWLGWGAGLGLLGLFHANRPQASAAPAMPQGHTVVLVPIYNEDPAATFARAAAMGHGLLRLGVADRFDIAILSDTTSREIAREEARWFTKLAETLSGLRVYYRRRENNVGRKAGNIADFITRSGGAYDYAVILDADSLMAAETLVELARRMQAEPKLGLIQTVPQIVAARSLFGRIVQFSASYYAPAFSAGTALLQGGEGPYWGHNAIVRVNAFAQSCGLPTLQGRPPFGGTILSHDYVEAALLARAGWRVELHPDLGGSYEEGPENLIEFAKRDRRWCQGNLQYLRLLNAPRLKLWNRLVFAQGILSYLASPVWLAFLALATIAADRVSPVHALYSGAATPAIWLTAQVVLLLMLPRLLIYLRGVFDGRNRAFGGNLRTLMSVLGEIIFTSLIAPVMLLLQCVAVAQILFGRDSGWPATVRGQSDVPWSAAIATTGWMAMTGALVLALVIVMVPQAAPWLLPVVLPLMLAPALVRWSAFEVSSPDLFITPQQRDLPAVDATRRRIENDWGRPHTGQTARAEPSAHAEVEGKSPVLISS